MMNAVQKGRSYAESPHVRFDEGEVTPAKPRQGSLLYNKLMYGVALCLSSAVALAYDTLPSWTLAWTNEAKTVGTLVTDIGHGGWTLNVRRSSTYYGGYGLVLGINSGKAFYGSAVSSGGGETGELDMRGTITGPLLDGAGTSTSWKIADMPEYCMRTDDGNGVANPAYAVKILRTPGTLLNLGAPYHNDGAPYPQVNEVYVDEPELTGTIPSWFCSGCTSLSVFVLKVPKVTTLSTYVAHDRTPRATTSFDDYDLSGVSVVSGSAAKGKGGSFQKWLAVGTLDLPSLETMSSSNACLGVASLGGVLLGTKGTLKSIGEASFMDCSVLSNVVLGASPEGVTAQIGPKAFAAQSLKRIWFNGANPPNFVRKSGTYTFGTEASTEGQMTFWVPDTPGWADVLAQRDASGMVPASVFNTAQKQYVRTWKGVVHMEDGFHLADETLAKVHGDTVQISGSPSDPSAFPYATAARRLYLKPLTLTATTSGVPDSTGRGSSFYRWSGVPLAKERQNPLILEAEDDSGNPCANFAHDWVYDASTATIANGNWIIKVSEVSATKRTLRIGSNTANGTYSTAFTGVGSGVLDFNGRIRDTLGKEWTLVDVKRYAMCRAREWTSTDTTESFAVDHPQMVVLPETLTSMSPDVFNFNQNKQFPLAEVVLIAPNLAGELAFTVNGAMLLERMTLRVPKVTSLGPTLIWQGGPLNETDVTDWDLSSVRTIGEGAFQGSKGMRGVLKFPALEDLGSRNFKDHTKLDGVVLATNLTLVSVGSNVFLNATALRSVVFGNSKSGVVVGENAFNGATGVEDVAFLGPRDETLADAALTGVVATTGDKVATVRASSALGWNVSVSAPVGDEILAKPFSAAGVYRAGSRKAWLEYACSPFDPRGIILIVQ